MKHRDKILATTAGLFVLSLGVSAQDVSRRQRDGWGPPYTSAPPVSNALVYRPRPGLSAVRRWNEIALNANALDHVPVAQAAHDTLVALFPSQAADFDALVSEDLNRIRNGHARTHGIALGHKAAAAILARRASDLSQHDEEFYGGNPYTPAPGVGKWRQDPISQITIALGSRAGADGNGDTAADTDWTPLGAPASNKMGPNFTPPFPAYASGHATFGAATFETLRQFYRTDRIRFTFVSDELNGVTRDNQGNVRPLLPRRFTSLSHAEEENGQSRIYLGIHWSFDKTEGIAQGRDVAKYVFHHAFTPQP